jgi:hypothetical protein
MFPSPALTAWGVFFRAFLLGVGGVRPEIKLEKVNIGFTFCLTHKNDSASIRVPAAGRRRILEN